jgi:release factor glutamine methyltransferase
MTARTALRQGVDLLRKGGIAEPRLTAEILLCHALRRERIYLHSHPEHELTTLEWLHYGRYLHERLKRKPSQYITRKQEFYGREFQVSPAVLIPRPETEHLVEHALCLRPEARRVLDIGTGSGILAITLALETTACVVATDLSAEALAVTRENARRLAAEVGLVQCDFASALRGPFDLIVSNPPYVDEAEWQELEPEVRDYEPALALLGGEATYRALIADAARLLTPGGVLIFEIGAKQQRFSELLDECWTGVQVFSDLAGRPRVIEARRQPCE